MIFDIFTIIFFTMYYIYNFDWQQLCWTTKGPMLYHHYYYIYTLSDIITIALLFLLHIVHYHKFIMIKTLFEIFLIIDVKGTFTEQTLLHNYYFFYALHDLQKKLSQGNALKFLYYYFQNDISFICKGSPWPFQLLENPWHI